MLPSAVHLIPSPRRSRVILLIITASPLNLEVEIKEGDELDLIYFSEFK